MVVRHVFDELVKLHQLMHGATVPLAVARRGRVDVLVLLVLNHIAVELKGFCGTIAAAKIRQTPGGNPALAPYGMFLSVIGSNIGFYLQ